jgi:hypothetical protein
MLTISAAFQQRTKRGNDDRNHQNDGTDADHFSPSRATIPAVKVSTGAKANCQGFRIAGTVQSVAPYPLATLPVSAAAAMVSPKRPVCCRGSMVGATIHRIRYQPCG